MVGWSKPLSTEATGDFQLVHHHLLTARHRILLTNRSQSLAVSIRYDDDKSRGAFPSLILTFYLCYMPPNDIRSRGVVNWGCIFMTLVRRSVCNLYCPAGDTCSHVTKFYNTDSCKMLFLIVGSCRWGVVWWFCGNRGTSKSTSFTAAAKNLQRLFLFVLFSHFSCVILSLAGNVDHNFGNKAIQKVLQIAHLSLNPCKSAVAIKQ